MTYSIVAFDGESRQWGVAVASRAMCVGAHVPWGNGGVGAVATQAFHDLRYGYEGLAALHDGLAADAVITRLTADDPEAIYRQLGVVDAQGRAASFTGPDCFPWSGGFAGDHWAVQGNILAGPQVVEAMAETFQAAVGSFSARLVAALLAGDRAGGDRRGRQSASVKTWIAPPDGAPHADVALFLRVDDAELPVDDLVAMEARVAADPSLLHPVSRS